MIRDGHLAEFRCVIEGAKPAAYCALQTGPASLVSDTTVANPDSELLFDTTAVYEYTPSLLSDDGSVWEFVAVDEDGCAFSDKHITITLDIGGMIVQVVPKI